ncbi:MAG TPA: hypothetical protein VGJ26_00855 [Pirellulales bacterium]|jgi:hypothetical protein
MFVVGTLFCLWLGPRANRAHQQRLAVQRIVQANGLVAYDRRPDEVRAPAWLKTLAGDDFFRTVDGVHLDTPLEKLDEVVDAMRSLPRLRRLTFKDTGVLDDDLARLAPLKHQLEELYFYELPFGKLTGSGLRHLSGWPRLKRLDMGSGNLKAAALSHVADLPALEHLTWSSCPLDAQAFTAICQCGNLRSLTLWGCEFDGDSLIVLKGTRHLERVHLMNMVVGRQDRGSTQQGASEKFDYHFFAKSSPFDTANPYSATPPTGFGTIVSSFDTTRDEFTAWLKRILPGIEVSEFWINN